MKLEGRDSGDIRIVTVLEDRIDAAVAIRFKDLMREQNAGEPERIVLDLSRVGFIDSSGLGAVVASMKHMEGRRLELAGLTPAVDKVFRLTRIDSIFAIHDRVEDALETRAG
ncbi:STAS domain-containing protein [Rhodosalinus sp.]|uniref:STAS domain-containing protein n=1 Tax=Rhodosalinus sp. TaxID=2047741 RepID=UPI0039787824